MDINDLRSIFTLILMVTFIAIVFWAWSKKRKDDFNEAANLPLNEPEAPPASNKRGELK
jgi:cytochrome c oxidase cbb3-type subunit IV